MRTFFTLSILCLILLSTLAFRPGKNKSIDGAWYVVSTQLVKANGTGIITYPKESQVLFSKGFYSFCWGVLQTEASGWQTPDSIKISRFNNVLVNSGTYEMKGSLLTMHARFALVPMFVNGEAKYTYHFSGDTLVLRGLDVSSEAHVSHPVYAGGGYIITKLMRLD